MRRERTNLFSCRKTQFCDTLIRAEVQYEPPLSYLFGYNMESLRQIGKYLPAKELKKLQSVPVRESAADIRGVLSIKICNG